MKVFNPKKRKNEDLFETLIPVYTVACTNDNLVEGHKGCSVYIHVSAENEEEAKDIAINNEEFMSHIYHKENFGKDNLVAFKPVGNYVIGKVRYFEGDERL